MSPAIGLQAYQGNGFLDLEHIFAIAGEHQFKFAQTCWGYEVLYCEAAPHTVRIFGGNRLQNQALAYSDTDAATPMIGAQVPGRFDTLIVKAEAAGRIKIRVWELPHIMYGREQGSRRSRFLVLGRTLDVVSITAGILASGPISMQALHSHSFGRLNEGFVDLYRNSDWNGDQERNVLDYWAGWIAGDAAFSLWIYAVNTWVTTSQKYQLLQKFDSVDLSGLTARCAAGTVHANLGDDYEAQHVINFDGGLWDQDPDRDDTAATNVDVARPSKYVRFPSGSLQVFLDVDVTSTRTFSWLLGARSA